VLGRVLRLAHRRLHRTRFVRELDVRLDIGYLASRLADEARDVDAFLAQHPEPRAIISVVVPLYKVPLRYVRELLEDLQQQTYPRWELCLCTDGPDGSEVPEWAAELAAAEPERVRLTAHAVNRGIAAATRSAIALARGDVILFVDGDDLLHPAALEAVARKFAASDELDVVYTDHDLLTDFGHRVRPMRKPAWSPELLLHTNYINHLVGVRRSCLERVGEIFPEDSSGAQDWDLCFKLSRAARRVAHVPLVLYHWRTRPGSVARGPSEKPWTIEVAHQIRSRHVRTLDPRLALELIPHVGAALEFARAEDVPLLRVIDLGGLGGAGAAPPVDYRGPVELVREALPIDRLNLARRLDLQLARLDDEQLVLIRLAGAPPIEGPLSRLAAYAILRGIGAVTPFRAPGQRGAYTVSLDGKRRLVPWKSGGGIFGGFTGNVMTGPLHGLVTRAGVVRKTGGFQRAFERTGRGDQEPNALGAALGLQFLEAGHRNVSVRDVTCALEPPPADVSDLPDGDPYF